MEYQHRLFEDSNNRESFADDSFEINKRNENGDQNKIEFFHFKSPSPEVNLTAQYHFNNRSRQNQNSSGNNNLTNQKSRSPTNSYNQRSLINFGVEREFSQLDQFLKETYERHGVYELIRLFVDMQDQLVSTFEYLKKLQKIKNDGDDGRKESTKMVSYFEEIDEVDQFSLQAQENIIHQFLYNLEQFFIPQSREEQQSNAEYSFSAKKGLKNQMKMLTRRKNYHIYTSRSKHAIRGGSKQKMEIVQKQKMMQSISSNNPIIPLKFEQQFFHLTNMKNKSRIPSQTIKMTHSSIISENILQSENEEMQTQQQLLKIIFDLRQQILRLNNRQYGQSESNPSQQSFYLDRSRSQRKLKGFEKQWCQRDRYVILDNSRQTILGNQFISKQFHPQNIINSFTQQLIIKQDVSNQNSHSTGSINFSQCAINKQNNPNLMNILNKQSTGKQSKHIVKSPQTLYAQFKEIIKTESNFFSSHRDHHESHIRSHNYKYTQSQTLSNVKISNVCDAFLDRYYQSFKRFFNIELQIQLILVRLITKRFPLKKQFHESFGKIIKYYSNYRINGMTRVQSIEKFIQQSLDMKNQLLIQLKQYYQQQQQSMRV